MSALAPEVAYFHQRRRYPPKLGSQGDPGDPSGVEAKRSVALGAQGKAAQGPLGDRGSPGEARPSFVVEWELTDGTTRGLSHVLHLDPQVPHSHCGTLLPDKASHISRRRLIPPGLDVQYGFPERCIDVVSSVIQSYMRTCTCVDDLNNSPLFTARRCRTSLLMGKNTRRII